MGKFEDIWNRAKDGKWKEQRSFVRYAIVATVVVAIFLFVKTDNVMRWIQAGATIRRQERQIENYRQMNDALDRQMELMSSDRDSLEKFARETFYFCKPDEDVFIIEER